MRVLLGVTGSVAATLTDKLIAALEYEGHAVKVVVTRPATYFWRKGWWAYLGSSLRSKFWFRGAPLFRKVFTDWDEWPGWHYRKNDPVLHIALREWADVLVVVPLTANTLAKLANGISDNLLTSVVRAWDPTKPMVLAPAMNTKMWEHPSTQEFDHCQR
jgi:phosphopantothenoylcysteine decarboxylase